MKRPNQEAWRLLSGWAAGTLTEKERTSLLSAAMEDQELFDALADEEALRELLSDEALRLRLAGALEPARVSPRWTWFWAAGSVLAGLALVVVFREPIAPRPTELARVAPPPANVSAPLTTDEKRPAEVSAKLPGPVPVKRAAKSASALPPQTLAMAPSNEATPPAPSLVSAPQPVLQDARQKPQRDEPRPAAVAEDRGRREVDRSSAAARFEAPAAPPAASGFVAADSESTRLAIAFLRRDPANPAAWREVGREESVDAGEPLRVRVTAPGPGVVVLRAAETRTFDVDRARTLDLDLAPYRPGEHTVRVEWSEAGRALQAKAARSALTMNQADPRGAPRTATASRVLRVR